MKTATKMMMLTKGQNQKRREGEYDQPDRSGKHYDGREWERGNHEPYPGPNMRNDYDGETYDRYRDRQGRERYDNGRYAPMRNNLDDGDRQEPYYPYVPPVYNPRNAGNKIGFSIDGQMEKVVPIESRMGYHSGGPLTKEKAEEWTRKMENEDGTTGPHWTMDQIKQVMAQRNIDCDPLEFYVAINMMYSDYCKVAKKLNVNSVDFYADMAKAFLDDKDAGEHKLEKYFEYIVK